jgi:arylsulfatase
VIISTDNGAEKFSWPDGGTSPFRGEKATTWEGGFRVPALARWPGVIKPGSVINDIFSHMDWMPTFLTAAGEEGIKDKLIKGHKAGDKTYKVHLDGYDQTALLKGEGKGKRKEIFYITDDGDLSAFRYNKWKIYFSTQESTGLDVWRSELTPTRWPYLTDLRADPYEYALKKGNRFGYDSWVTHRMFSLVPAQAIVADFLGTFKDFPPRMKAASFSVGDALSHLQTATQGK